MKRIYQHNDTYNEQKTSISRRWKEKKETKTRENKPALVPVLLEISFVFSPECIYTSVFQANKEKYSN